MGEVYRALDTRLDREVAIKVLPAKHAVDPDRLRRFEQETRAVAALNHPNVLALYDVGSHEGSPYLVTELLEGESLRDRLRGGALPVRRAVELAVQIVRGLAAAHDKGITHRDLKPGNVFVTGEGHVKILDFGIAKLAAPLSAEERAEASTVTAATAAGRVLGTVGYMSPEQARGQTVDHRSDLFSFGCVLYEMVTGRPPFARDTAAEAITAILREDPPEPSSVVSSVPPALSRVIAHCLEKDPGERSQSARDLAFDLRAVLTDTDGARAEPASAPLKVRRALGLTLAGVVLLAVVAVLVVALGPLRPRPKSVAAALPKVVVLPFENLGLPEDGYFASGMADEITSRLANVQGLGVISWTTATQYERKGKTVKQIGADLGVDYVLEGSVRWEHGQGRESRVRITPQLIRVADDTHVWADRYDRVLADVFAIQSEVAESTVAAMGVKLLPPEQARLKEFSTNDLEAYNLYLQGVELFGRGESCEIFGSALEKLQAAVDRDPRFAQALAMTGTVHLTMYWIHCDQAQEHLVKGREAAERAIELRPDLAEPHLALGEYFYRGLWDYPRALEEFAKALKIQPHNSHAFLGTGFVLRRQGHLVEATEAFEKGLELDPRNVHALHHLAVCYFWAGRYADADRALGRAIALSPQWSGPYQLRANLYVCWRGDVEKAQAILDEASHVAGINESFLSTRRWLALLRRDYPEALRLLDAWDRQAVDDPDQLAHHSLLRGQAEMLAGQGDLARRWYEAARVELEKKTVRDPNDAESHSSLGIAYAGLGRHADAVREAKLGCDLNPASKDPLGVLDRLGDLAQVYTMVGQSREAIVVLDDCLSRSGFFTVHVLRLDPTWDPLRSDPRFQALLTRYEVKP